MDGIRRSVREGWWTFALLAPALIVLAYFFLYPLVILGLTSLRVGDHYGFTHYANLLLKPQYRQSLFDTVWLSVLVTVVTLVLSTILAILLVRRDFPCKTLLQSLITFPISFPGVVVGFMIIILFGKTGVIPNLGVALTGRPILQIAYELSGLFLAYLYFSIPKTTMTMVGSVEKLNPSLEEAARSLGASQATTFRRIVLPALSPALASAGALAFATSMSAFGTAFTLSQNFSVLPVLMYTEYTLSFHIEAASAIAIALGVITVAMTYAYRVLSERG